MDFFTFQLAALSEELEKSSRETTEVTSELNATKTRADQLESQLSVVQQQHSELKELNVELVAQIETMKGNNNSVARKLAPSL